MFDEEIVSKPNNEQIRFVLRHERNADLPAYFREVSSDTYTGLIGLSPEALDLSFDLQLMFLQTRIMREEKFQKPIYKNEQVIGQAYLKLLD